LFLGLLLLAMPAWAQLKVGDDVSMTMNGTIGTGYTADYGNTQLSDHSLGVNGDANITGSFYNPNFLNFYVRPVYNRSQENSGSGSLTDSSSISAGAGIFSGTHFPGSVSFGKNYDSTGNYGLPGIQGFTTRGDSTQFGIGWSELLPGLPPLTASYYQSSSSSTIFGSDEEDRSSQRNFNLQSQYSLAGWIMAARFADIWTNSELPSFLTAGETIEGNEHSKTFVFNTNHRLPMQGGVALGYSYGNFSGEGNGDSTTGSNQSFSANANLRPWTRFTTSFGVEYDTDLTGLVEQQLIGAGSIAPQVDLGSNSHSLSMYNFDTLSIAKGLSASVSLNRTQQEVYGQSVAVNHFSGIVNYNVQKPLWGAFNFYGGVNDQSSDAGHQGTGLVAGVNFNKKIWGFELGAGFGYAQDVQTVLATQVTSDYSYLANARRALTRHLLWNSNFHGYRTGLGQLEGSGSHAQGFGTDLQYRGYAAGVTYGSSYGTALLTATGLVQPPGLIPPGLGGNQFLLENGSAYSATVSATPISRWTMSATYSKAISDTTTPTLYAASSSKVFTYFTTWQLRKISLNAGYTNLVQGTGAATVGGLPVNFSSFYIGIQRWFKPF
jgi:hypothetical protein